jgi:hypothetical protein
VAPALPAQVVEAMAQRRWRFHHYLWHRLRNSWLRLTESERQAVGNIDSAWMPPRPALDALRRPLRDNDSGEDFLFMHRRMIAFVNDVLKMVNDPVYPRIEGWRSVPQPEAADYPVPEFFDSELEKVKSAKYFKQFIAPWERQYTNFDYLREVTLGQLGSDMQFTIHHDVHMRWAAPSPVGYRPPTSITQEIDVQWDAPAYDYLGDTYSSPVNPIFWKLHGWMDDRVEDWQRAHGIKGEVEWKGTWIGPTVGHDGHADVLMANSSEVQDNMRRIDRIISGSRASEFDGFFRPMAFRPRPATAQTQG